MKTVLILSNHHLYTYNLRKEVIQKLIDSGYKVIIALPYGEKVELLKDMGCEFFDVPLERRGTNPFTDFKLFSIYKKMIKVINPDIVLTYTLKPNLYGGLACRVNKSKVIHTVTGLGTVFVRNVWYKKIIVFLNRVAFKGSKMVVFMNLDNEELYRNIGIISSEQSTMIVAGSGVNLEKFEYKPYPKRSNIKFTFIARILKDKGIEEFLEAAKNVKKQFTEVEFDVVGFVDEEKYIKQLDEFQSEGIINYLGIRDDIPEIMADSSCIVLPSYGEGRGTALQEGASIGRPLITCSTYGCRDNVDEGINGFLCEVANSSSLAQAIINFINLPIEEKILMGEKSREKAENEFDRNIVVQQYVDVIENIHK